MISTRKTMVFLWDVLLFSMMAFPRIMQSLKLVILILVIACMLLSKTKIKFKKNYNKFIFLWLGYHIYISITGIINGNNFNTIISNARFYILLFGILFIVTNAVAQQPECLQNTIGTSVFTTIYIGLYNIILMISIYVGLPITFLKYLDATANVGIHVGFSHIVTTNMSMLILLFPLCLFMLTIKNIDKYVKKRYLKGAVLISAGAMILSGRRIIWLILGVAIITYFIRTSRNPVKTIRNIFVGSIIIIGAYVFFRNTNILTLESLQNRFFSAFIRDESKGGESTRFDQMTVLAQGFLKNPIWGNGAAAEIKYIRSGVLTIVSTFEMSYNAVLFNGGVVGTLLYLASLFGIWKYLDFSKKVDDSLSFSIKGAFLFCVLANATNPYFSSSFDFLIMLFLPLVVGDSMILNNATIKPLNLL